MDKQPIDVQVNGVKETWQVPNPITPLDFAEIMHDVKRVSRIKGKYSGMCRTRRGRKWTAEQKMKLSRTWAKKRKEREAA